MEYPLLLIVAGACAVAAAVWARSALRLQKVAARAQVEFGRTSDAATVARSAFRKDVHSTVLYGVLAVAAGVGAFLRGDSSWLFSLVLVPVVQGRFEVVDEFAASDRGAGGFGSTGKG